MLPIILSCLTLLLLIGFVATLKLSPIGGCPLAGSLSGPATVERLLESLGRVKVLFVSGYMDNVIHIAGYQKASNCWQSRSAGTHYKLRSGRC
jgi:predicted esterase